jgi:sugar/nucleoside kinase (ribokinase family)
VGLGQNSVDYIAIADGFPVPNSKQALTGFICEPGGQVATALVACARLGWRTRYVGSFGDDAAGDLSRESLRREGVDISAARTLRASNRVAVILVESRTGERTVLWRRDPAGGVIAAPPDVVTSGRMLLVDCEDIDASTAAAALAREAGVPTMIDVDEVRDGVDRLLREIDAIIAAEEFPSALTGYADLGRALEAIEREHRAPFVCATLGARGSLARCNGREIRTPPFAVDCVDSTGAGDVFRAGFAAACLRWPGGDIEDVLAYANAAGALGCRALGARGSLPTIDEIDRLVQARSR